jgi:cytoskeletal protein RodZ
VPRAGLPGGTPTPPSRLGSALAAAREARGLSVEDVAAATRIRATLVRAIESDDFSRCGGAAYARGHLKSIAQVIGADGAELVAEFDRRYGDPAPVVTSSPLSSFEASAARRPTARWPSVAIGVLAVAAVFLGASWVLGRQGGSPGVDAAPGPSTSAGPTSTPTTTAPPDTTPPPTTPKPTPSGVTLRVRASAGDSWLLVTSSGGDQVYQGVLTAGEQKDFKDGRSLTVKFGNSHAVRLVLNGQDVGAPRCDNTVCSVQFMPPGATAG